MLIALGIFVAVMGGFLLNAENVTTCETDWEYVTDVGGAFKGDDSDMDVEYDPPANMTGWSAFDEYNDRWVSGVSYEFTESTTAYGVSTGTRAYTTYSVDVAAVDHDGATADPEYTLTISGEEPYTGNMPTGFGLNNPESVTMFVNGSYTRAGAFAAPLSKLSAVIPGYDELELLELSFTSTSSGYPCVAKVIQSSARGEYRPGTTTFTPIIGTALATASATDVTIDLISGSVSIGGDTVSLSDAFIIWGYAQFDGTGVYSGSCGLELTGTMKGEPKYMDAAQGVIVKPGTVTWNDMDYTVFDGSSSPSLSMTFEASGSESACTGTISYTFPDSEETYLAALFEFAGGVSSITAVTPTGGERYGSTLYDNSTGALAMTMENGVMTFTVNGQAAGTYTVSFPSGVDSLASIIVSWAEQAGSDMPSYSVSVTDDEGNSDSREGSSAGSFLASLDYMTYAPTDHEQDYSVTYWHNLKSNDKQSNASVTMAFAAVETPSSCAVLFKGPSGSSTINVVHTSDGWTVGGVSVGEWDAVELTVGYGKATVVPISSFRTFLDYETVDAARTVMASGAVGGGVIDSLEVSAGPTGSYVMRMAVTSTVIRITEGGLYLQNGIMDVQSVFPGSTAVSVMIGSAAAMGDSVTFSSTFVQDGQTVTDTMTIPVDASKGIYLGGKWRPFNGVTFRWVSTSMESQTIGGTTYAAAIYDRGQTYDAGAIWAQLKDGTMTRIIGTGEDWTMKLDGVWAPSVFLYTGENVASERTEIMDFTQGEFRWSFNDFIIVMMGVSIAGGLIGSYFRVVDAWDWAVIIGTVGALWLFLG